MALPYRDTIHDWMFNAALPWWAANGVDRANGGNAGAHALLGLIQQSAQLLGIEPVDDLAGKTDAANVFVG